MKTIKSTLIALLLVVMFTTNSKAESKIYSHLPLKLSEYLKNELSKTHQKVEKSLFGNIYLDFYIDENCRLKIVGLSSNNLELGAFVKNELELMQELNIKCPKGIVYSVKIKLSYL